MAVIQLKALRERFHCGSRITSCSAGKSAMSTGSMLETHHITLTQSYIQLHLLLTEKTLLKLSDQKKKRLARYGDKVTCICLASLKSGY